MARQGIVTPLANPLNGAVIGPAWAQAIRAISPRLTFARCSISADAQGHVPIALYQQGMAALRAVGLAPWGVLEGSLGPVGLNPNADLGWGGNPFLNEWINGWTLTACSVAHQLGLVIGWGGNEPNLQAAPNQDARGVPIPALVMGQWADPRKPGAMDPRVYFSALYQLGLRAKTLAPALTTLIPAALSIAAKFHTSEYDAWVGGYIDTGMRYLVAKGARPPWPWVGLSANMEGDPDRGYLDYTMRGYARHKQDHGIVGPTYIGEYAVPNDVLDLATMRPSFQAFDATVEAMAFFQFPTFAPGDPSTYGCTTYDYRDGLFVPGQRTRWYGALGQFLDAP